MIKENQYFPQSVPHPGETLAEKLEELGMGPKEFALRTEKPEKTITSILKGTSSITPDMAVKFEYVTRIPAHFWLDHQQGYDESIARAKWKTEITKSAEWAGNFPISDLIKKGWLPKTDSEEDITAAILAFFGFASHKSWEEYYLNCQLKATFAISLKNTNDPYAISAWLRKGELQAASLTARVYSEKVFKEVLVNIEVKKGKDPADFFTSAQQLCLEAGVKVVRTNCLPDVPIDGSIRWLKDTPVIQLSDNCIRKNNFGFIFFHAAGHLLLHGRKDIFLEIPGFPGADNQKEQQANAFACKYVRKQSIANSYR